MNSDTHTQGRADRRGTSVCSPARGRHCDRDTHDHPDRAVERAQRPERHSAGRWWRVRTMHYDADVPVRDRWLFPDRAAFFSFPCRAQACSPAPTAFRGGGASST